MPRCVIFTFPLNLMKREGIGGSIPSPKGTAESMLQSAPLTLNPELGPLKVV